MGTVLNTRQIDWVTAPGDGYSLMRCPPPACSDSLYLSSMWISTTGTITVEEVAAPGTNPNAISAEEKVRMQRWAFQAVSKELCCDLKEAETRLSASGAAVKLEPADITLSEKAYQLMNITFKIRADRVNQAAAKLTTT